MIHQWAQFSHHDELAFKLTDDDERELRRTQQAINSRLDMSFDELIAEMTAERQGDRHEYQ